MYVSQTRRGLVSPRLSSKNAIVAGVLLTIVGLEAVILLVAFGMGPEPLVHHDYLQYHQLAVNLLDYRTFSDDSTLPLRLTLYRPPGYPGFIAAVYTLAGRGVIAVRVVQFLLHCLTAFLVYLLGLRYFSRPT